ncbi:hypothetical protein AJ80_07983 [Polytolypa hystricis UAMH7299]|uniref:F-box domain-containing protein n=1 Tax=Polytolypa hystricis (strain UAMH7299) TaxID=1447883 RepID=A0A2B7X7F6_POLH7|nr:hypothetical protein AJ80_07983 [Polytolypa hystricis UAMH7299]
MASIQKVEALSSMESLPNELLEHIFSFLSCCKDIPSSQKIRHVPNHGITTSPCSDLKHISQTSRRFRELSLANLFSHARLELRDLQPFISFLCRNGLFKYVRSVVVSIRSIFPGSENQLWWETLLGHLDPESLTVIAPPHVFAEMAHCSLEKTHLWAFELPLQIMQFRQPFKGKRVMEAAVKKPVEVADDLTESTILSARPWSEIHFNEGSSLKAYNNYEYFLLHVPSIMDHWGTTNPLQSKILPYPTGPITRLKSFHYTAVFPFYNHTNMVLKVIRNMLNLVRLSIQLSPSPGSTILEDERERGSLNPNDPWMELDTSYSLISHTVRYLGVQGELEEFQSWDFERSALKDNLATTMKTGLNGKWVHKGDGLWVKAPPLEEQSPSDGNGAA